MVAHALVCSDQSRPYDARKLSCVCSCWLSPGAAGSWNDASLAAHEAGARSMTTYRCS